MELTTVTPVAFMSPCPLFWSFTVVPVWKLVPARLVMETVVPTKPLLGLTEETIGGGVTTELPYSQTANAVPV